MGACRGHGDEAKGEVEECGQGPAARHGRLEGFPTPAEEDVIDANARPPPSIHGRLFIN